MELSGIFGNQARNFFQLTTRVIAANLTLGSKAEKKTSFKEPLNFLISSLGGDISNITCSGNTVKNDSISGKRENNIFKQVRL